MIRFALPIERAGRIGLLLAALLGQSANAQTGLAPIGTWEGTYICGQGSTGLTLLIDRNPTGKLLAIFDFYGLPENPAVPEGCFTMGGTYDPGSGALELSALEWILQPPDYVSVDLSGAAAETIYSGVVRGPGCSSFTLQLKASPTHVPSPQCRPKAALTAMAASVP